jgi:hypothetical protein
MMAISISKREKDKQLSLAIVYFFILQDFNAMIKTFMPDQSIVSKFSSLVVGLIILAIFFKNLISLFNKRITTKSYLLFTLIYLYTIIYSIIRGEPFDVIITDSVLWTFAFWIPVGLFAYYIEDKKILVKDFYDYSFIRSALMLAVFFWFVFKGHDESNEYNMYFSYSLVVPLILHLDQQLRKGSFKLLVFLILEFSAIILYGSRGAILCIVSYFIFRLFLFSNSKQRFKNVLYLIVCVGVFYVISSYINVFENMGLHSRIIEKSEAGEAFSGRDLIWLEGVAIIMENPLVGLGIGGEFYQMSINSYYHIYYITGLPLTISSTTPHNGFLELMLCFGIPIGLCVSFYILSQIKVVKIIKDQALKSFMVVIFCAYLVPSFTVGDGIFVKPGIALFLFLALSIKKSNKTYIININNEYRKSQTESSQQQLVGA